jgi:hypothetical protein
MSVADLFLVSTKESNPLNAETTGVDASQEDQKSKVVDFVTQQSFLTFSVSTAVGKAIWRGFQAVFAHWADSIWVPFALAVLFGLTQFAIAMTNDKSKLESWAALAAFGIATTNTLVLWFAVLGVEPAAKDVGIT